MKPENSEGFWPDFHKSISKSAEKPIDKPDWKLNGLLYGGIALIVGILALVKSCANP